MYLSPFLTDPYRNFLGLFTSCLESCDRNQTVHHVDKGVDGILEKPVILGILSLVSWMTQRSSFLNVLERSVSYGMLCELCCVSEKINNVKVNFQVNVDEKISCIASCTGR